MFWIIKRMSWTSLKILILMQMLQIPYKRLRIPAQKQHEFKAIQEGPHRTTIKQYPKSNIHLEFRVGEAADTEEKRRADCPSGWRKPI